MVSLISLRLWWAEFPANFWWIFGTNKQIFLFIASWTINSGLLLLEHELIFPNGYIICNKKSQQKISNLKYCYCCSVAKSCLTLCDHMNCSTPGFPVFQDVPEFAQAHTHWVSGDIQLPHPLSPPSSLALNLSQQSKVCSMCFRTFWNQSRFHYILLSSINILINILLLGQELEFTT